MGKHQKYPLTDDAIREALQHANPVEIHLTEADQGQYRRAAVLVPLVEIDHAWHLLLTRRTDTVQDHKGQVSFPGGAYETGDENLVATALRETNEEVGLSPECVTVLGGMSDHLTLSNYIITPVVGKICCWPYPFDPEPGEVSRIFTIPISYLASPGSYEEKTVELRGMQVENVVFFEPYDGEVLWGISGRITVEFLKILGMIK